MRKIIKEIISGDLDYIFSTVDHKRIFPDAVPLKDARDRARKIYLQLRILWL